MPGTVPAPPAPYPALVALDLVSGKPALPFAGDPNATVLEHHARTLTNTFWSQTTWLTGLVDSSLLDTVCRSLEALHLLILPFDTTAQPAGERIERD